VSHKDKLLFLKSCLRNRRDETVIQFESYMQEFFNKAFEKLHQNFMNN